MVNLNKHIWEGWTAKDFIDELAPQLKWIQNGESWKGKINTKAELKEWCSSNQPYYKKHIPLVVNYFAKLYNLK